MVFKEQSKGKVFISIRHEGEEGEYIRQLRAMVVALGSIDHNSEARNVLTNMLLEMLPTESDIQLSFKNPT